MRKTGFQFARANECLPVRQNAVAWIAGYTAAQSRKRRPLHLHAAGFAGGTGVEPDAAPAAYHPVCSLGAMVDAQRFQLPAWTAEHLDPALGAYQDGKLTIFSRCLASGGEDFAGVLQKGAHEVLIASPSRSVRAAEIQEPGNPAEE